MKEIEITIPISFSRGEMCLEATLQIPDDFPPEKIERMKKIIAIKALENARIPPDYPPEVAEAVNETLIRLKAEYN